ncbi:MAG: MBL fold metallo-hydrolase [Acidimicrobiia bacterium]|nr:MBL fold metallo-hydrolase [Acidimicrobiia bacterium]
MGLTLTVLGCCGTYATPDGACSGYLLSDGATTVWIDAGPGTLANLQRHVPLDGIDALVLSHEHPDHWTDLEGFFNVCRFVTHRQGIPVLAPAGLKEHTYNDEESPYFEWREVGDGASAAVGGLSFLFSRTDHGPETLAMRVEGGGRSIGYTADTGPGWSLSALGPVLDLALCEATFLREHEGTAQHLSARQAGASAREADARRLLLTHVWPTIDRERSRAEAAAAYGGHVEVAVVNETYWI